MNWSFFGQEFVKGMIYKTYSETYDLDNRGINLRKPDEQTKKN